MNRNNIQLLAYYTVLCKAKCEGAPALTWREPVLLKTLLGSMGQQVVKEKATRMELFGAAVPLLYGLDRLRL